MTPPYCSVLDQLLLAGFYYSFEREAAHCLDCYSFLKAGVLAVGVTVENRMWSQSSHADKNTQRGKQNAISCSREDT